MAELGPWGEVTPYSSFTTRMPVAKIKRVTRDNPCKIQFTPPEFEKLREGDDIEISYTDIILGRSIIEGKRFTLGTANPAGMYFNLQSNGANMNTTNWNGPITGGFARVLNRPMRDYNTMSIPPAEDPNTPVELEGPQ